MAILYPLSKEPKLIQSDDKSYYIAEADMSTVNHGKGKVNSGGAIYRASMYEEKIDDSPPDITMLKRYVNAYNNFPIVRGSVEKAVQYTAQDFYFKGPDKERLMKLKQQANLYVFMNIWSRMRFVSGVSWIEPLFEKQGDPMSLAGFKFLDPGTMKIVRNDRGRPLAHVQTLNTGKMLVWGSVDRRRNVFKSSNFNIVGKYSDLLYNVRNPLGSEKYGKPLVHSCLHLLDIKGQIEEDLKVTAQRYISPIIHAKVGTDENPSTDGKVTAIGNSLKDIYADTEYVTGHDVEMSVLSFSNGGFDIQWLLDHIDTQILMGIGVPALLLGKAGADRAIAEVQLRDLGRMVKAEQRSLKTDFEDQIIQGLLGLSEENELVWGDVEERERMENINATTSLFQAGLISLTKANSTLPNQYQDEEWAAEQEKKNEMMQKEQMMMQKQAADMKLQKPTKDPTTKSVGGMNKTKSEIKNPLDSKGRNPSAGDK